METAADPSKEAPVPDAPAGSEEASDAAMTAEEEPAAPWPSPQEGRKRKRDAAAPGGTVKRSSHPMLRALHAVSLSTQRRPEVQRRLELLRLPRDDRFSECKARLMVAWRDLVQYYKEALYKDDDGFIIAEEDPLFPPLDADVDTLTRFYAEVKVPGLEVQGTPVRRVDLAMSFSQVLSRFYEEQGNVNMPTSAARLYVADAMGVPEDQLKSKVVRPMLKQQIMDRGQVFTRSINRKKVREERSKRNRSEQVQKMQQYLAQKPEGDVGVAGKDAEAEERLDGSDLVHMAPAEASAVPAAEASKVDASSAADAQGDEMASEAALAGETAGDVSLTDAPADDGEVPLAQETLDGCVLFRRRATPYKEQKVSAEGIYFRRGKWSVQEDDLLLKALGQACGMEGIDTDTLLTTDLRSHFAKMDKTNTRKDIWITTATAFPDRSVLQCQGRVRRMLANRRKELVNPGQTADTTRGSAVWTEDDIHQLYRQVKEKGASWREIGDLLGRTAEQVRLKWRNVRNDVLFGNAAGVASYDDKKKHKVKYSQAEMDVLLRAVALAYDVPRDAPKSAWPTYQKVRSANFMDDEWCQPEMHALLAQLYENGRNWESMTMSYYRWYRRPETDGAPHPDAHASMSVPEVPQMDNVHVGTAAAAAHAEGMLSTEVV